MIFVSNNQVLVEQSIYSFRFSFCYVISFSVLHSSDDLLTMLLSPEKKGDFFFLQMEFCEAGLDVSFSQVF